MGLVKFGSGIAQISGAVGGDVHFRNRFGNCIRPRTKPVNPHSARQEQSRADLSYLAEYWHGNLTPAHRAAWEVYAAAIAMTNRLGETIYLTGYNHFMRSNGFFTALVSGVTPEFAPVILSLPEKDNELVCSDEGIAAQTFTFTCDDTNWGVEDTNKSAIGLYQGIPQLASRNQFNGPWRLMSFIDVVDGALGTGTYAAVFPFGLGQKQWFQARLRTSDGRCTVLWQLSPRIIIADV